MRKNLFSLAAALSLLCSSCGTSNLYPVDGKLTCDGVPAAGAVVFFRRQGGDPVNEPSIMGITQDDGTFELVCGSLGKGAPPGEYDVLIEWREGSGNNKGFAKRVPDKLRGRYADSRHPLLHVTLEAQSNHLPPFEISNAGPPPKR